MMNIYTIVLWGFAATVILTTIMTMSKHLGFTRMDLPFILGTIFTGNRNKAAWVGFITHLTMGWLFAFIYAGAFETSGLSTWWFGATIGLVHGAGVLAVGLPVLNALHPRMARPFQGPTPTRQLEPPGFMALHYGKGTPIVSFIAHMVYGSILGLFYPSISLH